MKSCLYVWTESVHPLWIRVWWPEANLVTETWLRRFFSQTFLLLKLRVSLLLIFILRFFEDVFFSVSVMRYRTDHRHAATDTMLFKRTDYVMFEMCRVKGPGESRTSGRGSSCWSSRGVRGVWGKRWDELCDLCQCLLLCQYLVGKWWYEFWNRCKWFSWNPESWFFSRFWVVSGRLWLVHYGSKLLTIN